MLKMMIKREAEEEKAVAGVNGRHVRDKVQFEWWCFDNEGQESE